MKNILIIHTQSALNDLQGKEALDLSLIYGAFEQSVSVLFYQQGVFQTLAHQDPESLGQKDYLSTLKALDIYDVEQVYACKLSLESYSLEGKELLTNIETVSLNKIEQLKLNADHVLVI